MKTGKKLILSSLCLVLVLALLPFMAACVQPAQAPTPTSTPTSTPVPASVSFAGKTVTIIIPSTAGGGTDTMGRIYAKYLTKYLPGNPTVIVRNMPGAGGSIGTNYAYNAKPDGLTLQVVGGSPLIAYFVGASALKCAFLSGETNMSADIGIAYRDSMAPYVEKGEVMLLFQTGIVDAGGNIIRDPDMPPIPTIKEFYEKIYGKSPSGMAWETHKTLVGITGYDKILALAPGTPDSIVRAYWDAGEKMIKDPDFKAVVGRLAGQNATWRAGETLDKEWKVHLRSDPKIAAWLKDLAKTKYNMSLE